MRIVIVNEVRAYPMHSGVVSNLRVINETAYLQEDSHSLRL